MKSKGFMEKQEEVDVKIVKTNKPVLWDMCEELEYRVFVDCGYIEPNEDKRNTDYDSYEHAEYIAAFVGDKRLPLEEKAVGGIIKIITAPYATKMKEGLFPTLDHPEELPIFPERRDEIMKMDPKKILDMASMAIDPKYRDSKASKVLCTRVTTRCWELPNTRYGLAAIDTPFYNKLKERGYPYIDIGPSSMYMGSMTTPTIVDSLAVPKGAQWLAVPYFFGAGLLERIFDHPNRK